MQLSKERLQEIALNPDSVTENEIEEMTNYELGNKLDEMAEEWAARNGTTCFDNYIVVHDDTHDEWYK